MECTHPTRDPEGYCEQCGELNGYVPEHCDSIDRYAHRHAVGLLVLALLLFLFLRR